ncbi:Neuronal acetylcholine receptor subunit alpha-7 [Mactra antiquata]
MFLLSITVLIYGQFYMCATSSYSDKLKLYSNLTAYINPRFRPVLNQTHVVNVNVVVSVLSITEINEREQSITCSIGLTCWWVDETLRWDVSQYGGTSNITLFPNEAWLPEFIVGNTLRNDHTLFVDNGLKLNVTNSGIVTWHTGGNMKTSCPIDISNYPFDTQTCSIIITKTLSDDEMDITLYSIDVKLFTYFENEEWALVRSSVTKETIINSLSSFKVTLFLKRRSLFYIINIILPMVMVSFMNILCFKIPPRSGERISYCVSLLLTFVVLLSTTAETMPKMSDNVSYLQIYIYCQFWLGCFITTISAIIVKVDHSDTHLNVPRWCQLILCLSQSTKTSKVESLETNSDRKGSQDMETFSSPVDDESATANQDVLKRLDEVLFYIFISLFALTTIICIALVLSN